MKRLILMRHAKSTWDDPTLDDHDRPLNGRGRVSARVTGDWLRAQGYLPDLVLSSTSARTRETYARLNIICDAQFLDGLYHASSDVMMRVLQKAEGETLLMLGHNPGIAWFAQNLVAVPPPHSRFYDYPTCATLVADFEVASWSDVRPGSGQAKAFVIPRELTG